MNKLKQNAPGLSSNDPRFLPRAYLLTFVNLVNTTRVILNIETPTSLHTSSTTARTTPGNEESHS